MDDVEAPKWHLLTHSLGRFSLRRDRQECERAIEA